MSDSKHTPGSWTMRADPTGGMSHEIYGSFVTIARTYAAAREHEANARLIAAAPDLLAACKAIAKCFGGNEDQVWPEITAVRNAIAKAEGK